MISRHALLLLAAIVGTSNGAKLRNLPTDISPTSQIGSKLLSKARKLNNDEEEVDLTWVVGYSLKFQKCHTLSNVYGGEGNKDNQNQLGSQNLVTFKLCPSNSCSSGCSKGGEYVVEMREFVEAFLEAKEEAYERACEAAQETCEDYCDAIDDDGNDDDACKYQCMSDAGMENCDEENQENDDDTYAEWDFEEKEFMECRELEIGDDDGGDQYYIGPICSNSGQSINLGLFSDASCSTRSSSSIIEEYYGKSLPYENDSMVSRKCISCLAENDGDDDYNKEPVEMCEQLLEQAGRCEKNLKISSTYEAYYTPSNDACKYIHKTLPAMAKVSASEGSALVVATALAWTFGLGCVVLGGLSFFMYNKAQRSGVKLLDDLPSIN